jgi:co-chaperonin GroES (HSP10)
MATSRQKRAFKDRIKAKTAIEELNPTLPPAIVRPKRIPRKKYRTLNNHFLVKRLDLDDAMTPGGLHKPEIARDRSQRGEIRWSPIGETECPVGTTVIFTKYGGSDVTIHGEKLSLVQRLQLYAIEEDLVPGDVGYEEEQAERAKEEEELAKEKAAAA